MLTPSLEVSFWSVLCDNGYNLKQLELTPGGFHVCMFTAFDSFFERHPAFVFDGMALMQLHAELVLRMCQGEAGNTRKAMV